MSKERGIKDMGLFFNRKKKKEVEFEEAKKELIGKVVEDGLSEMKRHASSNESFYNDYNPDTMKYIGVMENFPIFFCGKVNRDKYIEKIESMLNGRYKFIERTYVYPENIKGIVDKCLFQSDSGRKFYLFLSIYSFHNMSDYVPEIVYKLADDTNVLPIVMSYFAEEGYAEVFLNYHRLYDYVQVWLTENEYDEEIQDNAREIVSDIMAEEVKAHEMFEEYTFKHSIANCYNYLFSDMEALKNFDEELMMNGDPYLCDAYIRVFQEKYKEKYQVDLPII